jgi:hypothetical protein
MIEFTRLQRQESEITKLVIQDKLEFTLSGLITYFDGTKKIKKLFEKTTRPYSYSEYFKEYFNTPEELLRRYKEKFYTRNLMIWKGRLYEGERIVIKTEGDKEGTIYRFRSPKEVYSFLKKLQETIDAKGLFAKVGSSLVSFREFLAKYGDLDSLNIE